MTATVQTVTGPLPVDELGPTLMHEHVIIGMPGWDTDALASSLSRREMLQIAKDRVAEMQDAGIRAMVDPCPSDLGRDIGFCAEVSQVTGFPIVGATGFYNERAGSTAYWKLRRATGADLIEEMTAIFVQELTVGADGTDVRAGIIKVATGNGHITDYEKCVLGAASKACLETGVPIITHTDDGVLRPEQQAIFALHGVPPHRVIIGHSCGTSDHDYHWQLVEGGTYLGFDRFGLEGSNSDENRTASLLQLIERGAASRVVVSHDTVWCWLGKPLTSPEAWRPSHFSQDIVPALKAGGATDDHIDQLLVQNPRRFFADEPLPPLG